MSDEQQPLVKRSFDMIAPAQQGRNEGGPLCIGPMVGGMPTSCDGATAEGRSRMWQMLEGEPVAPDEVLNVEIGIVDYLVDTGNMVDTRTGEVYGNPPMYLMLDDGRVLKLWSPYPQRTLARYIILVRQPPFRPPIKAKLTARKSPNSPEWSFHKLVILDKIETPKQRGNKS